MREPSFELNDNVARIQKYFFECGLPVFIRATPSKMVEIDWPYEITLQGKAKKAFNTTVEKLWNKHDREQVSKNMYNVVINEDLVICPACGEMDPCTACNKPAKKKAKAKK